ncbi:MAG: hypothetical protein IJB14_06605, partial [Firmicutes bacterium]|nr:hypothetical protein [Bacillota bacterium]
GQSLIVVSTFNRAKRLACDLSFFDARNIYVLPPEDESIIQYEARSNDQLLQRMKVLKAVTRGEDCIVIAPATGAVKKLPPKEIFEENVLELQRGKDIDIDDVKVRLSFMGYERVPMIESRGEYSIRGGILDIFTPDSDMPYRVELFDTEIDSIRTFEIDTQRSSEELIYITICQCSQLLKDSELFAKAKD